MNIGYSKGRSFVKGKGKPLPLAIDSDVDDGESIGESTIENEIDAETDYASKYFRFFSRTEGKKFGLFIEHGLNRNHEVQLMKDHRSLLLNLEIPVPEDEMFKQANFHASMAEIQPVKEEFVVDAPGKLNPKSKEIFCYPSQKTPLWTVYTYLFEEEAKDEAPDKIEIDLTSMLTDK